MLDGNVQIFDDLRVVRDLGDELVVKFVGVEIVQAQPLHAVDLAQLAAELGEAAATVKVRAIARDVLRDDDELMAAGFGEPARFR